MSHCVQDCPDAELQKAIAADATACHATRQAFHEAWHSYEQKRKSKADAYSRLLVENERLRRLVNDQTSAIEDLKSRLVLASTREPPLSQPPPPSRPPAPRIIAPADSRTVRTQTDTIPQPALPQPEPSALRRVSQTLRCAEMQSDEIIERAAIIERHAILRGALLDASFTDGARLHARRLVASARDRSRREAIGLRALSDALFSVEAEEADTRTALVTRHGQAMWEITQNMVNTLMSNSSDYFTKALESRRRTESEWRALQAERERLAATRRDVETRLRALRLQQSDFAATRALAQADAILTVSPEAARPAPQQQQNTASRALSEQRVNSAARYVAALGDMVEALKRVAGSPDAVAYPTWHGEESPDSPMLSAETSRTAIDHRTPHRYRDMDRSGGLAVAAPVTLLQSPLRADRPRPERSPNRVAFQAEPDAARSGRWQ
jgi:cell division protein FtsL